MLIFLAAFLPTLLPIFSSRAALELENLVLRHQNGRAAAFREKAAQVDSAGPSVVGPAVRPLERLTLRTGYRSTRDRHCLASQELSSLLNLENPTWQDDITQTLN